MCVYAESVDYERVYVDEFRPHPGVQVCFNVTILEDSIVEGREFFLMGLLDHRWGEVLSTIPITILDNDSEGYIHAYASLCAQLTINSEQEVNLYRMTDITYDRY